MKTLNRTLAPIVCIIGITISASAQMIRVDSTNGALQGTFTNLFEDNLPYMMRAITLGGGKTNAASASVAGWLSSADWSTFNAKLSQSSTNNLANTNHPGPVLFTNSANLFKGAFSGSSSSATNVSIANNPTFVTTTNIIVFYGAGNATNNVGHTWNAGLGVYTNAQYRSIVKFQNPTWYLQTADSVNQYSASSLLGPWSKVDGTDDPPTSSWGFYLDAAPSQIIGNIVGSSTNLQQVINDMTVSTGAVTRVRSNGTRTNYTGLLSFEAATRDQVPGETWELNGVSFVISNACTLSNIYMFGNGAMITSHVPGDGGVAICPYMGTELNNFSIKASSWPDTTPTSQLIGTDYRVGQPAITNAVIRNVKVYGNTDGFYFNHTNFCSGQVYSSFGVSKQDIIAQQGGPQEWDWFNCVFDVCTNGGNAGMSIDSAVTNRFHSSKVVLNSGASITAYAFRYANNAAGGWLELNSGEWIGKNTATGGALINLPVGSTKVVVHGTKFKNRGASSDLVAIRTANSSATGDLYGADVFGDGGSSNQFIISSSKGQLNFWGGNVDPALTTLGSAKVLSGATNLFLKEAAANPASTNLSGWIWINVGGTLKKMATYDQ